jgi:ATP-binding protein involved in chromosome partitioning
MTQNQSVGELPAPLSEPRSKLGVRFQKRAIPGVTEVIAVASGKGGVGKSTVSVNLAVALAAQGARVGLLDGDIYGPSAPTMFGVQGPLRVGDQGRIIPHESHGVKVISFGFFADVKEPVIWRGPMIAKAFRQFCYDVQWGECDYLVIDLPPGTGDVQLAMVENIPVHGAVIVTTPQDVALIDAHKAVSMFLNLDVKVLGLVENMAFYECSRCGHQDDIFGHTGVRQMADERGLRMLGSLPLDRQVRQSGDLGQPMAAGEQRESHLLWYSRFQDLAHRVKEGLNPGVSHYGNHHA